MMPMMPGIPDLLKKWLLAASPQYDFGKVYSVKGQNMKKLDCPSFPMVCGPMFYDGFAIALKRFKFLGVTLIRSDA